MPEVFSDSLNVLSRIAMLRAKRVINLPIALTKSLKALATGEIPHIFGGLDPAKLRLQITIASNDSADAETKELVGSVVEYAGRSDWTAVADLMRKAEATRSKTDDGHRHASIISSVAQEIILHGAGEHDTHPDANWQDRLSWLEAAFDASDNDHILAAILAKRTLP